jgi:hypothetical protein
MNKRSCEMGEIVSTLPSAYFREEQLESNYDLYGLSIVSEE